MKYRLMSDLHLEFSSLKVPKIDGEDEMTLILAGDVGVAYLDFSYVDFITEMCERHEMVLWVMGNHEYYRNYLTEALDEIMENLPNLPNLLVTEKDVITIRGVAFILATLWTDFENENPMSMMAVKSALSDYHLIHNYSSEPYSSRMNSITPQDTLEIYKNHKKFIFDSVNMLGDDVRKVVVTHHAPSFQSVDAKYRGDPVNGGFASELGMEILDSDITRWHHGHMHQSTRYMIGNCEVVANPRGYHHMNVATGENWDFDPSLVLEV